MTTSTKVVLALGIVVAVTALTGVALGAVFVPLTRTSSDPKPTVNTIPAPTNGLSDGTWFGWVRVHDAGGSVQLLIDPADMLTGEQARAAAVVAGVIAPHEDLPNDFFIDNPNREIFTNTVSADATLIVSSAVDPAEEIYLTPRELHALFSGAYEGELIYGIIPGQSIPMTVTVSSGLVTAAAQVYLP